MKTAIPEEIIIFEILKRLPAKTLCRFRTVSKRWLSIITSRPFIDTHFQHSKLNPTRLFGFYGTAAPTFLSTNNPQTSYKLWDRDYLFCSTSPRGLICLYGSRDGSVQIWNPSTGEHIEVNPKPPRKRQKVPAYFLGFDPVTNKHKLLSFVDHDNEYYVLTLGEKKWRKIITSDGGGSSRNLIFRNGHRSSDGIVYYFAQSSDHEYECNLVAFDVGSESFLKMIRLPVNNLVIFGNCIGVRIGVYRGRIVLLDFDFHTGGFEMWVLEDVEKQKWSPMRIIPPPLRLPSPSSVPYNIGVDIDGEELVLYSEFVGADSEGFQMCRYDLEKGRWSETRFPDLQQKLDGSARYRVRLYSYVDNLESLKSRTLSIEDEDEEEAHGWIQVRGEVVS